MVNNEAILIAIDDLNSQEVPNIRATAKKHHVSRSTLQDRFNGKSVAHSEARSRSAMLLTNAQESVLIEHINKLSARGLHPSPQILENLVVEIIGHPIGERWVERFCKRHNSELKSIYLRNIDQARHIADNSKHYQHYFDLLHYYLEKYHIKPSNIYNFDEKGFLLGICRSTKRIVPRKHLESKKTIGKIQDGSREFISLLATICADGTALAPALIYQGDTYDLQDTWLEDYDHSSEEAYFAVSKKGWTNEELGLSWLSNIFEPITKPKAGYAKRLLIVDGHSSHVNMKFIDYCDQNGILLGILPPHSTHRLQPLDVAIFSPLVNAYSGQIDTFIQSSSGFGRITKRVFWSLFRNAWKSALTSSNVYAGFTTTGICPFDPSKVLQQIHIKTPSPLTSDNKLKRKTPKSVRGVRRAIKAARIEDPELTQGLDLIIRATEKLVVRNEILEHENQGLRTALIGEKKRRKRGKTMELFTKDKPGQAIFFSPGKIAAARERQQELEAQKEAEKLAKQVEKRRRATEKEQKAQEIRDRKIARQELAAQKREAKIQEKEARKLQKQANQQVICEQPVPRKPARSIARPKKRKAVEDPPLVLPAPKLRLGRNGRKIALPERFYD